MIYNIIWLSINKGYKMIPEIPVFQGISPRSQRKKDSNLSPQFLRKIAECDKGYGHPPIGNNKLFVDLVTVDKFSTVLNIKHGKQRSI